MNNLKKITPKEIERLLVLLLYKKHNKETKELLKKYNQECIKYKQNKGEKYV